MTKIFISTGEVSGDLQASMLIAALKRQAQALNLDFDIVALGGPRMAAAGATLLANTVGISSIGPVEALRFVLPTLSIFRRIRPYLRQHPPDLTVLIDYIGVNVPMGDFVRKNFSCPIVYFIAPQEWVWAHSLKSTQKIVSISDRLLAIFPEEARYYARHGAKTIWVGHPMLDRIQSVPNREQARQQLQIPEQQLAIALFPASRDQEIKSLLPIIFEAAQKIQTQLPQVHFWIPLAHERFRSRIQAAISRYGLQATMVDDPLTTLAAADLALAKSGTVNLETALLNVPQIVIYRINPIGLWLYLKFLKFTIKFASPPNLICDRPIVPELLQDQATPENIAATALDLLTNNGKRQQMQADYQEMRQILGEPGAVERAAQEILQLLQSHLSQQVVH